MYSVYTLIDPRDDLVHYVGISKNVENRFYSHVLGHGTNREKNSWITDLKQFSLVPKLKIIASGLTCEEAQRQEIQHIQHYLDLKMPLKNRDGVTSKYTPRIVAVKEVQRQETNESKSPVWKISLVKFEIIKSKMEELLTPDEVARLLKLSEYTVKDMLRSGKMRGVKSGNRWRVRQEDLRDYVERNQKTPDTKQK